MVQVCVPYTEGKGHTQGHKAISLFTFVMFIAMAGRVYLPPLQPDGLHVFCQSCMSCVHILYYHHSGSLSSVMNFIQPPILSVTDATRLYGISALGNHCMGRPPSERVEWKWPVEGELP